MSGDRGGVSGGIPENERKEKTKEKKDSNPRPLIKKNGNGNGAAPLPQSTWIMGVILDFSREFGDTAHEASNVTQALRLWAESGLGEAPFVDQCQAARRTVRHAQAHGVDNKMAYFFTVLRRAVLTGGVGEGAAG